MIRRVKGIVSEGAEKDALCVVVSAFGGITNQLEQIAVTALEGKEPAGAIGRVRQRHQEAVTELLSTERVREISETVDALCTHIGDICRGVMLVKELSPRSMARLLSAGELLSSIIIEAYLKESSIETTWKDSREYFVTTSDPLNAKVHWPKTRERISNLADVPERVIVIPGFIARDEGGFTTTLGRGGSDYTAAVLASVLEADALEIWTDVSGMMTADPRYVTKARPVEKLSYAEAMELSFFGAKVIYPPTIQPLIANRIPLYIRNTMDPDAPGTYISDDESDSRLTVKGITCIPDVGLITVSGAGMVGVPGTAMRMFRAISQQALNILFITQSSSEHTITVGLQEADAGMARDGLQAEFSGEIERGDVDEIILESGMSLVAAVGDNMRHRPGIAGKLFGLLGDNGVNIRAIAQGSTERNVSFVIAADDTRKTLNVLHEGFFLSQTRVVHLFNIGVGNVGSAMLSQLGNQVASILDTYGVEIRMAGLANSKHMMLDADGIDPQYWQDTLDAGKPFDKDAWVRAVGELNLRNSIFVDNTASVEIADLYLSLINHNAHVVTSNKIAAASDYTHYEGLKKAAAERGVQFLYETNVAAGLPVIKTMRDMLLTGDAIHRIEAVLSGSLNYIFNAISPDCAFSEAVAQARAMGLTEPDPAIDLSGLDVQRKILILAREAGYKLNIEDVGKENMMPESIDLGKPWEALFDELKTHDSGIEKRRLVVEDAGRKWRFMAVMENGRAGVGLREITGDHPAWHLGGKDNLVLIYSSRYKEQPMVIKGAGAGPDVTAAGVLSDILRIANV